MKWSFVEMVSKSRVVKKFHYNGKIAVKRWAGGTYQKKFKYAGTRKLVSGRSPSVGASISHFVSMKERFS